MTDMTTEALVDSFIVKDNGKADPDPFDPAARLKAEGVELNRLRKEIDKNIRQMNDLYESIGALSERARLVAEMVALSEKQSGTKFTPTVADADRPGYEFSVRGKAAK